MKNLAYDAAILLLLSFGVPGQTAPGQGAPPQGAKDDDAAVGEVKRFDFRQTFLADHPGSKELDHHNHQLNFKNAGGTQTSVVGAVTHQDRKTGAWVANAPVLSETKNGWRVDGTENDLVIRRSGSGTTTVTQTASDYGKKHDSVLSVALPALSHEKEFTFSFTKDGLPWKLHVTRSGAFGLIGQADKKRGAFTYAFGLESSEPLTVNGNGDLVGDARVNLTRAVMISNKSGKRISCSPWRYSKKDGAAFLCDDSDFRDEELPYTIDPTTQSLTDPGSYYVARGSYSCSIYFGALPCEADYPANVTFNIGSLLPAGATVVSSACSITSLEVSVYPYYHPACSVIPDQSGVYTVRIAMSDFKVGVIYLDWASVSDVTLSITWSTPISGYSFRVMDGNYQNYSGNLLTNTGYIFDGTITDPDGDFHQPEILITGNGTSAVNQVMFTGNGNGPYTWCHSLANDAGIEQESCGNSGGSDLSNSQARAPHGLIGGASYGGVSFARAGLTFFNNFIGLKNVYVRAFGEETTWHYVGQVNIVIQSVPVTITSAPVGRTVTVDGSACNTPCTYQWMPGSTHTLSAANYAGSPGSQYIFKSWSPVFNYGSITVPGTPITYTASFTSQYQLTTSTVGSSGSINPPSGWYNAGAVVQVSATAVGGFRFTGFTGDLTGTTASQNLTMTRPMAVVAGFSGYSRYGVTQVREFEWSGQDLVRATNPENGTVRYTYDGAHRVTSRTDAGGQRTEYDYDTYGRLTQVRHYPLPSQEELTERWTYSYDTNPLDGSFSQNAMGRMTAVQFGSWDIQTQYMYSYNQAGRVSRQRMHVGNVRDMDTAPVDLVATYGWDTEGRMTSLGYPSGGSTLGYQYDSMGRLGTIETAYRDYPAQPIATAAYNGPEGQLSTLSYGGLTETHQYNTLGQITRMTVPGVMDMQYVYSATQNNGRITQSIDTVTGEQVSYRIRPVEPADARGDGR